MVSDSDLVTRLREILGSCDLNTATPATVRRQLEADLGVDLSDKKAFIRDQIDVFLESRDTVEENLETPKVEEDNNSDEIKAETEGADGEDDGVDGIESEEEKEERPVKAKKRGGGFTKVCQLSPQLEKVVGTSQLARTEVVKKIWAYIREKDLQDPKDRRKIVCDELLHSLFRVKTINMFQMNKALAKHIWPLGDGDACNNNVKEEDEDEDEASEGTVKKEEQNEEVEENKEEESEDEEVRNLRKRKRKKPAKSAEKPKRKGGGGFTKVCSLSPELQAFTGVTELARTEVVKMLWKYIKENNLQDPNDGRTIICDESLRSLFPVESINMFQMNKQLAKHIRPLEDNAGEPVRSSTPENGKEKMETDEDSDSEEPNEKDKRQTKEEDLAPLPLSVALVKFLGNGESSLSRADVVKRLWEYIEQNDLQDPSDKRRVICDEKLKELFEVDSFEDTSVSKLLTNHFIKTEQMTL